jgi:biopolymer transport protein ExbD
MHIEFTSRRERLIFVKAHPRRYNFKKEISSINFTKYSSKKRKRLKHLSSITFFIWFFWFLNFAARLGPIPWFISTNFHGFTVAQQSSGIRIPVTQFHKHIPISATHLLDISITRTGKINIQGNKVTVSELPEILNKYSMWDPQLVAFLIIDRECKMGVVNTVLFEIKKSPIREVYFFTSEHSYKM